MNKKSSIVLVHGWSQNPNYFDLIKPLLEKRFKVYTPIMPGFDSNKKIKTPYDLNKYSNWLNKFILTKQIENPILLGHSFGGSVCTKYLLNFPNPNIKLILVDAAIIREPYSFKRKIYFFLTKLIKPIVEKTKIKKQLLKILHLDNSDYQKIDNIFLKKTFQNIIFDDLSLEIPRLKNRTLIIWGENDLATPPKHGKKIHQLIKKSIFKVIPNSDHFPFVDNPSQFISLINQF